MPAIVSEETVLEGQITVEKASLREDGKTFERYRVVRQDASAVLLYNPETDSVILTRQFRYPVTLHETADILECVAGKIDEGESPEEAALRETEEETGYRVAPGKLRFLTTCYASPGYSTERYHLFVAEVSKSDKRSEGGGEAGENEKIELVEMPRQRFLEQIGSGEIRDVKTCLAGMLMR